MGHTLIEILLALGLSLVILAAVYAALDQHWRYADAGQRQTEQMQMTRALFEQISADLRSVVFRRDAGFSRQTAVGESARSDVDQRVAHYFGRSIGIVGDGQKLVLRIDALRVERSIGVQTIRWQMHPLASKLRDNKDAAQIRGSAAMTSGPQMLGLTRLARDGATFDAAKTIAPNDLLAAEVEAIRFRYFAHGGWFERWDSVEEQELPQAVEITISFRKATLEGRTRSGGTSPGEYRLVVPVPASEA